MRPRLARPARFLLLAGASAFAAVFALGGALSAALVGIALLAAGSRFLWEGLRLTRAICAAVAASCEQLGVARLRPVQLLRGRARGAVA